jgi:hypothetical protein
MFPKSTEASSHVKDANPLYPLLAEIVEEVGVKQVVQVIMGNLKFSVTVFCISYSKKCR